MRLLASVAGQRERIDTCAAAVIESQQVADRDDEGLARDVLGREERVFLEPGLEHESKRRRDARHARRVLDRHDIPEHGLEQPVEVRHVRGTEVDLVLDRAAQFPVDVLAEFLRVVDAHAHRKLLDERRRQLRLRRESRRRAGRQEPEAKCGEGRAENRQGHRLLPRMASAFPSGRPTNTPPLRAHSMRISVA